MKFLASKIVFALLLGAISSTSIAATLFNRADFGSVAIEYDFENSSEGQTVVTDGNLQISGGEVGTLNLPFPIDIGADSKIYDSDSSIELSFFEPIAAVGFNFVIDFIDSLTLSLLDETDSLLSSTTLSQAALSSCPSPADSIACGFIGVNAGVNLVSKAVFEYSGTVINQFPFIDNIIFQTVPTPGIIWLFGPGLLALVWNRKRKAA